MISKTGSEPQINEWIKLYLKYTYNEKKIMSQIKMKISNLIKE